MTLNEAAALLGLSPATLRVQVYKGRLKAKKVGPVWTVTPGEVERYRAESLGRRLGAAFTRGHRDAYEMGRALGKRR